MDEINSILDSLNIKSSKCAEHSITATVEEFESALSVLPLDSVKAGDGEDDSSESSRFTELHTRNDVGNQNQDIDLVSLNAKNGHGISSGTNAQLRSSKGIKQKKQNPLKYFMQ